MKKVNIFLSWCWSISIKSTIFHQLYSPHPDHEIVSFTRNWDLTFGWIYRFLRSDNIKSKFRTRGFFPSIIFFISFASFPSAKQFDKKISPFATKLRIIGEKKRENRHQRKLNLRRAVVPLKDKHQNSSGKTIKTQQRCYAFAFILPPFSWRFIRKYCIRSTSLRDQVAQHESSSGAQTSPRNPQLEARKFPSKCWWRKTESSSLYFEIRDEEFANYILSSIDDWKAARVSFHLPKGTSWFDEKLNFWFYFLCFFSSV